MESNNSDQFGRDILFSRTIKAGSRVYYLDVKRCSTGDVMMSITESRKLLSGDKEEVKPTFERHRIFIYQEDLIRFKGVVDEAMDFIESESLLPDSNPHE